MNYAQVSVSELEFGTKLWDWPRFLKFFFGKYRKEESFMSNSIGIFNRKIRKIFGCFIWDSGTFRICFTIENRKKKSIKTFENRRNIGCRPFRNSEIFPMFDPIFEKKIFPSFYPKIEIFFSKLRKNCFGFDWNSQKKKENLEHFCVSETKFVQFSYVWSEIREK